MKTLAILILTLVVIGCSEDDPTNLIRCDDESTAVSAICMDGQMAKSFNSRTGTCAFQGGVDYYLCSE
jgi:hypothetical protein